MGQPLRLPSKLFRFFAISREERRELLGALGALLWARKAMKKQPLGELVASRDDSTEAALPIDLPKTRRLSQAVVRMAGYVPFEAACLMRSLAIQRLLDRSGLNSGQIRIGVNIVDGEFLAHAWVEVDGRVMGDTPAYIDQFTPVTDVTAVKF